ncbi:MAG: hypothetical protein JNJ73_12405 [Hyphomonadaceae bacterium]|nr:hypothetical protein [Hyphomonadaceae bacterium]
MRKAILAAAMLAVLGACGQQPGAGGKAGAAAGAAAPPANAEAAITAWARGLHGTSLIEPVAIFYGDFSGDGAVDALAWADYETGGSSANHTVALFRNEGGAMTFLRTDETVYGSEPREVGFTPGFIRLTTTMPKEGDPHCCPTGSQEWMIETGQPRE